MLDSINDVIKYLLENLDISEVAIDLETSGLSPHDDIILLIAIAFRDRVFLLSADSFDSGVMTYLLNLINSRNILVVNHNVKFDIKFLYHNYSVLLLNLFDTMLAENLAFAGVGEKFPALDTLAARYLNVALDKETRKTFIGKTDYVFTEEQMKYAKIDAACVLLIKDRQIPLLKERGQYKIWEEIERRVEPVVAFMEYTGIKFDQEEWLGLAGVAEVHRQEREIIVKGILERDFDKFSGSFENAYEALANIKYPVKSLRVAKKNKLKEIIIYDDIKQTVIDSINYGSYRQVGHIMTSLGVEAASTNKKELMMHSHQHEIVRPFIELKEYKKKVEAFGEQFLKYVRLETSTIHCNYNQLGAQTGRFSSDNPNLQNIIADSMYRQPFKARQGFLLATADHSNIELRIIGEASKEPFFIDAFAKGLDLHRQTASLVFQVPYDAVTDDQRRVAKSLNFAIIYGTSARGIAYNFGMPLAEAEEMLLRYFEVHSRLKYFIQMFGRRCLRNKQSVTLGGRRRFLSVPKPTKAVSPEYFTALSKATRRGVNHLPQGTSADMIKKALIFSFYESPFSLEVFRPLLTVHDEIVFEFKSEIQDEAVAFIDKCMRKAGEAYLKIIPEAHEIKIDSCWRK